MGFDTFHADLSLILCLDLLACIPCVSHAALVSCLEWFLPCRIPPNPQGSALPPFLLSSLPNHPHRSSSDTAHSFPICLAAPTPGIQRFLSGSPCRLFGTYRFSVELIESLHAMCLPCCPLLRPQLHLLGLLLGTGCHTPCREESEGTRLLRRSQFSCVVNALTRGHSLLAGLVRSAACLSIRTLLAANPELREPKTQTPKAGLRATDVSEASCLSLPSSQSSPNIKRWF